jgi:hypothetical protein
MLAENQVVKYSYQIEAFKTLKLFFGRIDSFYKKTDEDIATLLGDLPEYLLLFLQKDGFSEKIQEINRHTASLSNFQKRFFNYFNAFRILKYLNFVHPAYMELTEVKEFPLF